MTTDTQAAEPHRPFTGRTGRLRFARIGRVVPVAVVQIVVTLAASRWSGAGDGSGPPWAGGGRPGLEPVDVGPLAVVLLVAGVVALPFRWRWPVAVLAVSLGTTIGYALVVSPRGPFVAALTMALANAWFRGHRVAVWVAAGIAVVVLPWADTLTGRAPFASTTTVTLCLAWLTATVAITEVVRVRVQRATEARRARAAAERARADDERVRIARELHDSVAHSMSLINLQAGVALHLGGELPEPTQQALTSIRDTSKQALVELRRVLGVLRAVDADRAERTPTPGLARVADLVERARAAGLDVTAEVHGDPSAIDGVVDRSAFRIAQESITNVMKHAPDHRATLTLDIGTDVVDLVVEDEPTAASDSARRAAGVPPALFGESGNGIIGMRERAIAVGGEFRAGPRPDGGWTVVARLPSGTPERDA
ncbi:sensor histidine kinase [Microbacterium sp. M1A1_1b]